MPSIEQLQKQLLSKLIAQRDSLDARIKAIGGSVSSSNSSVRRPMSKASRAKISKAQKARWAKERAAKK